MIINNVLSLFDGDSCGQIALSVENINVDNYFSSEVDEYAVKVTQENYPDTIQLGDIRKYKEWHLPKIDLIIGGPPCQDLSCLKVGNGLNGEKSKLLHCFVDILNKYKPEYFLLENVVPRKKEWKAEIDRLTGVEGALINSDLFVQQNRPRIYWTNIPIAKLPIRPNWKGDFYQFRRTYFRKNKNGVVPCLTANMGTGGHNVPLYSEDKTDKLTPEACERLQGMPAGYTDKGLANCHRYKMIGNGWTVDVIAHILKGIKDDN